MQRDLESELKTTTKEIARRLSAASALLAALKATRYHESPCERGDEEACAADPCAPCMARAAISRAEG